MTRPQTISTRARQCVSDATVLASLIDPALVTLDRALAGWPEQTPGAAPAEARAAMPCTRNDCTHIRPCPDHDEDPVVLTRPEALASQGDPARRALDQLAEHVRIAAHHLAAASTLAIEWGKAGVTSTEVADRLDAIWCRNCLRCGKHEPRDGAHLDCAECRRFRARWKRDAPKAIIDARGRGRNLNEVDEKRILDRDRREQDEADRAAERRQARAKRTIPS